jgi:hypothetical protein
MLFGSVRACAGGGSMDHRDVGHQPLLHQRSLMLESQEKKRYPMHVGGAYSMLIENKIFKYTISCENFPKHLPINSLVGHYILKYITPIYVNTRAKVYVSS